MVSPYLDVLSVTDKGEYPLAQENHLESNGFHQTLQKGVCVSED